MADFVDRDYVAAADGLLNARADLWRMGGSIAQRDLVEWTLTEPAIRAKSAQHRLVSGERKSSAAPGESVNQHFPEEAEVIRI